jgi:autotransporter translocation and assembly factor TamB
VSDSNANNNHLDGITLDAAGGVSIGNVASFNGRNGILAPNGTVTGNTVVRNVSFGISATCPSSIVANTVVGNTAGSIDTSRDGCVVVNNATRP